MALCIQIIRDGEARRIRWGWWHVERATDVVRQEVPELADRPLLNLWSETEVPGTHTVVNRHTYHDVSDGEVFTLEPGDVIHVWRDR